MNKHILVIADGRSAITQRWIEVLKTLDFRVTLVSTYPMSTSIDVDQMFTLPVAFSSASATNSKQHPQASNNWKKSIIQNARPLVMKFRYWLGPLTLTKYQKELIEIVNKTNPDIVHALRIPYEGMLASAIPNSAPLLISIWGNDFTLHARANAKMGQLTRKVMHRADGVLADVHRDITLAHQWGLAEKKPTLVVPGGGGIDLDEIKATSVHSIDEFNLPEDVPLLINPRGIRAYAQTDTFFKAIPLVLDQFPNAMFLCPAMKGKPEAENWVQRLSLQNNVRLLDTVDQQKLWSLFHRSMISLSITTHDGTPNTLIEAMACGCFPIAGDIESIREWIVPGVNGFLVNPHNHQELAQTICLGISQNNLRINAKSHNFDLIKTKAEVGNVKKLLANYYSLFLKK